MARRPNDKDIMQRAEPRSLASNGAIQQLLMHVLGALQEGDTRKAAQRFIEAKEAGILNGNAEVVPGLLKKLGKKASSRLVDGLVRYPCFYCSTGLIRCETCDGQGHLNERVVCDHCIGLGMCSCDFCGGSGWITIEAIPNALHAVVVAERAKLATRQAKAIVQQQLPAISSHRFSEDQRPLAKLLLLMERQRAVLENALETSQQLESASPKRAARLRKTLMSCLLTEPPLLLRMRACLRLLAKIAQLEARRAPEESPERELASSRMRHYASLCTSREFACTPLEKPRLGEASRKLTARQRNNHE